MQVTFPTDCCLNTPERHALEIILGKDDLPCDGCLSREGCPAYAQEQVKQNLVGDPTACPYHLSELSGPPVVPTALDGAFIRCAKDPEDWAFSPDFAPGGDEEDQE
jgi:hypothetical protein